MAGQPGRSGGANRSLSTSIKLAGKNAPNHQALAVPGWYTYRDHLTREEIFEALSTKLNDLGLTDENDGPIVSMLASQYEILQDAQAIYDAEGPAALLGRALASRIIGETQKEIRSLLGEWYLTPSTRGKRPDAGKPESGIDSLLRFSH